MKLIKTIKDVINEQSRFDVLYNKMVNPGENQGGVNPRGLMNFKTLKDIIFADPTTKAPENFDIDGANSNEMNKVKVGKYAQWLLKNFINPKKSELNISDDTNPESVEYKKAIEEYKRLFLEDLYKTTDDLKKFEKAKPYLPQDQRDINKFTPATLFDLLKDFEIPEKKQGEIEKKEAKKSREGFNHAGGEVIFEGSDWTVIKISDKGAKGKDAAIWYGGFHEYDNGESRWCTSSPGLNYFETYMKNGPLYVIFPNNDNGKVGKKTGLPKERYQFHFNSNQFMDRDDRQIDLIKYLNGSMSELKELFKSEFTQGLVSNANKVEIVYPEGSGAKFMMLYGFDELFKNLPKTISGLYVSSKKDDLPKFDVPDSIGDFDNLEQLLLQNIIKSLPESIGNLKKLKLLSLPGNTELLKLPESISELPDLKILNLMGKNPNLEIPKSITDKMFSDNNQLFYNKALKL
jgi:hypothetical protein